MENVYQRTQLLIGENALNKIKHAKVCVFGVGGVGGYVVENLARAGVGEITLVDFDTISITNINRQLIALSTNIGKFKVDEYALRINQINKDIKVNAIKQKLSESNIEEFNLKSFDYIVDAIDDVKAKVALCEYAYKHKLNIISSMGSGNKFAVPDFQVVDIFKTEGDKLAKKMRHELKAKNVNKLDCVFCKTLPVKREDKSVIASISYFPAAAGVTISAYVINQLIKGEVC